MFQHLVFILVFSFVNAEEQEVGPAAACGNSFSLGGSLNSVLFKYRDGVFSGQCEIEFTIDSTYTHKICVQPISLNLDCETRIEYQKFFVASSINDGELTCELNHLSTYDEMCVEASTFFIVVKSEYSLQMNSETAEIRVYAKETHRESSSSSRFNYAWVSILPGIIIVICVAGVCARNQRRRQCTNTNINYTTTTGAATINTGYPQATIASNNTGQQQYMNGYNVHPAVTASQVPPVPGPYNYQYAQPSPANTSAPPQNEKAAPPPSYESLVHQ